jgi:hypothetical protein
MRLFPVRDLWSPLQAVAGLLGWFAAGCASFGQVEERYVACPYDTVWGTVLTTVQDYPLAVADKGKGMIETVWVEKPVQGRPFGLLSREGLPEKERFRTTVTLRRSDDVTVVRLSERREHWGFRGGSRIYQWYPVEPSPDAMRRLTTAFTTRLENEGCFIGS